MTTSLTLGRRRVEIPNPDKLLFPGDGITKRELAEYYARIAPVMLPHLRDRPLHMQRFPDGIEGEEIQQKQASEYFPDWIHRTRVPRKSGGFVDHVLCQDAATLVYLAGQACITPHTWLSRADRLDQPDLMIFDLDPPGEDGGPVREAARALHDLLGALGLPAFLKATGGRGLHVAVPLDRSANFDEVRAFAREVAAVLAARHPDRVTAEIRKEKRSGRVFIDTMRNAYGQTTVAPYAVRARPGAPVAVPLEWEELDDRGVGTKRYSLHTVFDLLDGRPDPWADLSRKALSLERARRKLGRFGSSRSRPRAQARDSSS